MDNSLLYTIWLGILPGLSADRKMELMRIFGSERGIFEASAQDLKDVFRQNAFLRGQRKALERLLAKDAGAANTCLRQAERIGAKIVSIHSDAYSPALRTIKDPPFVLFALGDVSLLHTKSIAIVGTRRASPYGRWAASEIAARVGRLGVTIVSGMAEGIDSAAHRGCLQAGGKTVAVFGTGVDVCFPKSNIRLYEEIREKGLLLSEYPFGLWGRASNFPERNRIISGLCESCVVVEGAVRSGSLITAGLAAEQGRDVFALPGNINQMGSCGTNLLIAEGVTPIHSMEHLTQTLGLSDMELAQRSDLSEEEAALLRHIRDCGSTSKEYILETSALAAQECSSLLICLELKGLVRQDGSQIYCL